jgi:hypothetical protein
MTRQRIRLLTSVVMALFAGSILGSMMGSASAALPPGCNEGNVLATAFVDADSGFSSAFTTDGVSKRHNCGSDTDIVRARRTGVGAYEVRFPGISNLPGGAFVATVDVGQLIGGVAPSADLNISSATRVDGDQRTLVIRCADVEDNDDTSNPTDLCDFSVALFNA